MSAWPLSSTQVLPFFLAVVVIELTPGPNMAYLGLVSLRHGRAAGFATVVGVTLGLGVYLIAAVVGLAELAATEPWAYAGLRWIGVGYLLWIAYQTWRGRTAGPETVSAPSAGRLVARGFLTNVLNPKAAIFYLSMLPGFTQPDRGQVALQSLLLGMIHVGVALLVHLSIVMAAGTAHPLFERPASSLSHRLQGAFAVSLVGVAAWVAWSTHPH